VRDRRRPDPRRHGLLHAERGAVLDTRAGHMRRPVMIGMSRFEPRDTVCARTTAAVGSLLAALAASSRCLLPVVLFSFGASGAWIGTLVRWLRWSRISSWRRSLVLKPAIGWSIARALHAQTAKYVARHLGIGSSTASSSWRQVLSSSRSASISSRPSSLP